MLATSRYTHVRMVDIAVVRLNPKLAKLQDRLVKIIAPVVGRLVDFGAMYKMAPRSVSRNAVFRAMNTFRMEPPQHIPRNVHHIIIRDFMLLMALADALNVLRVHGADSFHKKLLRIQVCR